MASDLDVDEDGAVDMEGPLEDERLEQLRYVASNERVGMHYSSDILSMIAEIKRARAERKPRARVYEPLRCSRCGVRLPLYDGTHQHFCVRGEKGT